jgi:AraC-like DNA-binding protein
MAGLDDLDAICTPVRRPALPALSLIPRNVAAPVAMAPSLTQYVGAARILWRLLEARGIDPRPIYARAGIALPLLHAPQARIGVQQMDQVWREALGLLDDPCIALEAPEFWRPGDFNALDHAWLAASTLEAALRMLARYLEIVDQSGQLSLERSAAGLTLCGAPPRLGLKDFSLLRQGFIAIVVHMARLIAGATLTPMEVAFRAPASGCADAYGRWFGCPVRFSAPRDCVVFDRQDLTRPLDAHPEVGLAIERVLCRELARLRTREGIVGRVQANLADGLPAGRAALKDVAAALTLSPSELQRRLEQAGTSFRGALDEVRQSLAEQYLRDPSLSLIEIAFLLGFSEQSAFTRACRRWFGAPPSMLRGPA